MIQAIIREDGRIVAFNGAGFGYTHKPSCQEVNLPDQDVSKFYDVTDEGPVIKEAYYPADVVTLDTETRNALIDKKTCDAIDLAIHPYAWEGEQLGIMRDQIVRILNGDMTASEDFARLNAFAIAEIEKGQTEKEALTDV